MDEPSVAVRLKRERRSKKEPKSWDDAHEVQQRETDLNKSAEVLDLQVCWK